MLRRLGFIVLLLGLGSAQAEVMEVNVWKTLPGKAAEAQSAFKEARAIHQRHGAGVSIINDFEFNTRYVMFFEDWEAWNKSATGFLQDKEWQALLARGQKSPVLEHHANHLINVIERSETLGSVVETYIWEPLPGGNQRLFDAGLRSKKLHEKAGVSVLVGADRLDRMIYSISFPDWGAYAKFMDTPNAEYQAFMAKEMADPAGKLVEVITGSVVD